MKERKKCKFLISVEFEEVNPEYTKIFTMEKFIEAVRNGYIMNDDGCGYLAKVDGEGKIWESELPVDCYVNWLLLQPQEFTHVCWYNK
jgi:hypothetical protein